MIRCIQTTFIVLGILALPCITFADPTLLEVMFARNVVLREPVDPFVPGAYCSNQDKPVGPIPVINSKVESRVYLWSLFINGSEGLLHHSWIKDGVEKYGEDLKIGESGWWRSWSSKEINPKNDRGNWKVVVSTVDPSGTKVLCQVYFRIE